MFTYREYAVEFIPKGRGQIIDPYAKSEATNEILSKSPGVPCCLLSALIAAVAVHQSSRVQLCRLPLHPPSRVLTSLQDWTDQDSI